MEASIRNFSEITEMLFCDWLDPAYAAVWRISEPDHLARPFRSRIFSRWAVLVPVFPGPAHIGIIYIFSRTGPRRSDLRFLRSIKIIVLLIDFIFYLYFSGQAVFV